MQIYQKPPPGAQINLSHPLARGMVGCWMMNDGGQRCYDLSPYKNHGTLIGFDSPPKRNSLGLQFDGVNDYVYVSNSNSLNIDAGTSLTIMMWVQTTNTTRQSLVYKVKESSPYNGYLLDRFTTCACVRTTVKDSNSNQAVVQTNTDIIDGKWHLITGVLNRSDNTLKIYLDGVLHNSVSTSLVGSLVNTGGMHIGTAEDNLSYDLNGQIDEVRIYNRALSAHEVKESYINPYSIFEGV